MFRTKQLIRKVISASVLASVALAAIGFTHMGNAAAASSAQAENIMITGQKFLGVPYRFGASTGVTTAFDCSSFTQYVYQQIGITLPRTSTLQSTVGIEVARSDLDIGDLVFFKDPGRAGSIGHVGIYAGDDRMLHIGGVGGVKFSDINSEYYKKNYVTARRIS